MSVFTKDSDTNWRNRKQQTVSRAIKTHTLHFKHPKTWNIFRHSLFPSCPADGWMGAGHADGVCTLCFLLWILSALRGAQATWQHFAAPLIRSNSQSKQTTAAYGRHISSSSLTQTLTSHFHQTGGSSSASKPRTETVRSSSTKPGTEIKQANKAAEKLTIFDWVRLQSSTEQSANDQKPWIQCRDT